MKKKLTVIFAIAVLILISGFCVRKTKADSSNNASGWLWGGGTQTSSYPPADGTSTNVGWISMNNTNRGESVPYGINIPTTDGPVTGYAWGGGGASSGPGIGWVDFDPQDHCTTGTPDATHYAAASCLNNDGNMGGVSRSGNNLIGWARIVGIVQESANNNSGGWQGWIKLNGTGYGVSITSGTPNTLNGYVWSDELGWIYFGGASFMGCSTDNIFNLNPQCAPGTCGSADCGKTVSSPCIAQDKCGSWNTVDCGSVSLTCSDTTCPSCTSPDRNYKEVAP